MTKKELGSVRDQAIELVCSHRFPWCRARLLHALAGAAEQGVLEEVMGELLGDQYGTSFTVTERMVRQLQAIGWLRVEGD